MKQSANVLVNNKLATVEFDYYPRERGSLFEPPVAEEFDLLSLYCDGKNITPLLVLCGDDIVRQLMEGMGDEP